MLRSMPFSTICKCGHIDCYNGSGFAWPFVSGLSHVCLWDSDPYWASVGYLTIGLDHFGEIPGLPFWGRNYIYLKRRALGVEIARGKRYGFEHDFAITDLVELMEVTRGLRSIASVNFDPADPIREIRILCLDKKGDRSASL